MKQVIVLFLKNSKSLKNIRKRYDPNYKKFKPHITLVYPFSVSDKKEIYRHINSAARQVRSFKLVLSEYKKSAKEYYLYLVPKQGKIEIIHLYNLLNQGILRGFENLAMPKFIPHLTVGVFNALRDIDKAKSELEKDRVEFEFNINQVQLLTIDHQNKLLSVKNFNLYGNKK